ncbi:MAG: hypothetical protein ACRERC_27345 [Candidatus Binatia bacterium]
MIRRMLAVLVTALALLSLVRTSDALFHLAVIDEVVTAYSGNGTVQYIEVRMLGGAQNLVANSIFAAFDASGAYVGDILQVPSNVANSGTGVRWIVATAGLQYTSGLVPDFVIPDGSLPLGGGMVCFGGGGGVLPANPPSWSRTNFANYVDCVAYGTYAGSTNALIGNPTPLDGDGNSMQRTTSTLDNETDFTCDDLTPQNNAGATVLLPAQVPCPVGDDSCPPAPDPACLTTFGKGLFMVKESPPGKEKLLAKLIGGPALSQTDLGNPLSAGGTVYNLCVYDDGGTLLADLHVDQAGDACGTNACWKALGGTPPGGKGYKYKDTTLAEDGVFQILYKGGAAGSSKALVKGRGPGLPPGLAGALQSATSATVQLRGDDAPQCLSLTVTDIKKQESDFFKAKK